MSHLMMQRYMKWTASESRQSFTRTVACAGVTWFVLPICPAKAKQLQLHWLCRLPKPTSEAKQVKKRRKRLMQPSSMSGDVEEASMLQGLGLPTSFGTTRVSRAAEMIFSSSKVVPAAA